MNPGELNKHILIGKTKLIDTENGFKEKEFDTDNAIKVWSKVNGVSNKEFYSSNSTNLEDILNFTIRYRKDIDSTMQVKYNDKIYDIQGIDDFMEKHEFLTLRSRRVKNNVR